MSLKTLDVCAAVVIHNGRLLLATRRPGSALEGLWEFPGGKCEPGETWSRCIQRELREELSCTVVNCRQMYVLSVEQPERLLRLHFIRCQFTGSMTALCSREGQQYNWFRPDELASLSFAPADRQFLLQMSGDEPLQPLAAEFRRWLKR